MIFMILHAVLEQLDNMGSRVSQYFNGLCTVGLVELNKMVLVNKIKNYMVYQT